jgi:hypothetical protein
MPVASAQEAAPAHAAPQLRDVIAASRGDTTVIALWLGHADMRSTQPYLHADLTIKERALALVTPTDVKPGRYKPPDTVLAFLEAL